MKNGSVSDGRLLVHIRGTVLIDDKMNEKYIYTEYSLDCKGSYACCEVMYIFHKFIY